MKSIYLFPGQWAYSAEPAQITTVLGSCVAVALFDSRRKAGALNHFLLPSATANEAPSPRYGDVAIQVAVDAMLADGSLLGDLQAKVYGGANVLDNVSIGQQIGNRNVTQAIEVLSKLRIPIVEKNVGGTRGRRIMLSTSDFSVEHGLHGEVDQPVDTTGFGIVEVKRAIRVVIVDDSPTVRNMFKKAFEKQGVEVVGVAANAYEARELIVQHRPDAITLDIEMPRMDGLTFLEKLMNHLPTPVVVVSSLGAEGEAVMRALKLGAVEFIHKPSQYDPNVLRQLGEMLTQKVKAAAAVNVLEERRPAKIATPTLSAPASSVAHVGAIVIGGNSGSVDSLKSILMRIPSSSPPVIISNGTLAPFADAFAHELTGRTSAKVVVARQGEVAEAGHVYLAPADRQLRIVKRGSDLVLDLQEEPPVYGQRPSSSVLFESAAAALGSRLIGVLLSGYGVDGVDGMERIGAAGGTTIAEDPGTAAFPFAPQTAIARGLINLVLPAAETAEALGAISQKRRAA